MQRLLPAIVLCAGLQSALAAAPDPAPAAQAPATIVQAQLDVRDAGPGPASAGPRPGNHTASKSAPGADHEEPDRPLGMLFAALALMTGIALRRWDMGQR